jgi:hypothetical protein
MRTLHDHRVNPVNDQLTIAVTDEPGAGGANHRYEVAGFNANRNDSWPDLQLDRTQSVTVLFQNGPIAEHGVNGITQEVLLAIVADRLRSFQAGPYSCKENSVALTHVETAMLWLRKRTLDRMQRGVEGTSAK